jgi:hypothetical protein
MATKKKAAKKKSAKSKTSSAATVSLLRFNPRWFTDPGPDAFRQLGPSVVKELNALKTQFTKQFNAIVKRG